MQFHFLFVLLLLAGMILSVMKNKLTVAASFAAAVAGALLYIGTGFTGVWIAGTFFILGVAATACKNEKKQQHTAVRDAWQVLANGGIAAVCGGLAYLFPLQRELLLLMIACSLSSSTADTVSSELGTVYGKRFYNMITLKKDMRGENGAVSLEGIMFGISASLVIAAVYCLSTGVYQHLFVIVVAGTIGNLVDSILGASLERRGILGNNAVNLLNTLAGACTALVN